MLKDFSHNLALRARVLFSHRSVNELDHVFIEMGNEVLQVFAVGVWVQALAPNPLNCVPFIISEVRI